MGEDVSMRPLPLPPNVIDHVYRVLARDELGWPDLQD
jgi:hypothetical protein